MKTLNFIYPYYDNPKMLEEQIKVWSSYNDHDKRQIEIVIVDDCSPTYPAIEVFDQKISLPLRLYRYKKNLKWHQDACLNLGATVAYNNTWLFTSAMDHVMPHESLRMVLDLITNEKLNPSTCYIFRRVTFGDRAELEPSEDVHLIYRDLYWDMGGRDEDLCGYYGADLNFIQRLKKGTILELLDAYLIAYLSTDIPDAITREFSRDKGDRKKIEAILKWKARTGNLKPAVLKTPWERIL